MAGRDPLDENRATATISEDELATIQALKQRGEQGEAVSLLVYHRDGIQVVPLAEGQSLIIGRAPPADVPIRDNSLSRQHARFERQEGEVWVEDLKSTNGTWIRGEKVERSLVVPGTELSLGRVAAVLNVAAPQQGRPVGVLSHDRFQAEIELEVHRARAHGRSFALLMIGAQAEQGGSLSHWFPGLDAGLRPFDRLALYSTDTVEILLPEVSEEQALGLARSVVESQRPPLRCGLALYPDHAGSAAELTHAARKGLHRATAARSVQIAASRSVSTVSTDDQEGPIVSSPSMQKVFATSRRLANSVIPVLIQGETGTGKEIVARAIHEGGKRAGSPMICVNCGAIPAQLVESTLFGHEKGAFTGAQQQMKGVFESADGGTVLLDEVGELPAAAQAALLRVLETKRICRVGSSNEIAIDARVLAATHRDLEAMCKEREFREDLLYRLNAMTVSIPPLRERRDEIDQLARHFIQQANEANECQVRGIDEAALELLARYAWPGNVRELRNAMERAVVIAMDDEITVEDLPERIRQLQPLAPAPAGGGESADAGGPAAEQPDASDDGLNLKTAVNRCEYELILRALDLTGWNRQEAADLLGVSLRTLATKTSQHGIRKVSPRG